jgi:hypothetical protein
VLAEVAKDEREQVALGVLVAELLGDLVGQVLRQVHASRPLSLADCTRLITTAARWLANSLTTNS